MNNYQRIFKYIFINKYKDYVIFWRIIITGAT